MYKDVSYKNKYYISQIIKSLRKENKNINIDNTNNILNMINKYSSIFKYNNVHDNDYFDIKKLKSDTEKIVADLSILYKTINESIEDFNYISDYINCHIEELENYVDKYKDRVNLETNNTTLGETIYYQNSDFYFDTDEASSYMSLGSVSIPNGVILSCFYEGEDIPPNITFNFYKDDVLTYVCEPYSINGETVTIYGSLNKNYYSVSLDEDLIVKSSFPVTHEDLEYSYLNEYRIYGGQDMIKTVSNYEESIIYKNPSYAYTFNNDTYVSFYIVGGSNASFDFSQAPEEKNFSDYNITFNNIKKISFKVKSGTSFHVVTDGIIFAEREIPIIKDNILYYPKISELRDFLIEEITPTEYNDYLIILKIANNLNPPKPKYISIKQIDSLVDFENND